MLRQSVRKGPTKEEQVHDYLAKGSWHSVSRTQLLKGLNNVHSIGIAERPTN